MLERKRASSCRLYVPREFALAQNRMFAAMFCLGLCGSLCSETVTLAQMWSPTESLGTSHGFHTATVLGDGKVLVAGGIKTWSPSGRTRVSELYDPTSETWSGAGLMQTGRQDHTATLLADGRVLVSGGLDPSSQFVASCELYDPVAGTGAGAWSNTGSMGTGRARHTATLLPDGKVLVCGGFPLTESCELYDASTEAWSPTDSMGIARTGHSAAMLGNGRVIVVGGSVAGGVATNSCELYDYDPLTMTGTWSFTGMLNVARGGPEMRNLTATILGSGKLLATGGLPGVVGDPIKSCELYDSVTESWSLTGDMAEGRRTHSATLLRNGRVLAAGGTGTPIWKASCELYDPGTGTWSNTDSLAIARSGHTATLLGNWKVLAVGGTIAASTLTPLCELYEASSIPAVSEWGLVVMTLLLVTGATVVFVRNGRLAG